MQLTSDDEDAMPLALATGVGRQLEVDDAGGSTSGSDADSGVFRHELVPLAFTAIGTASPKLYRRDGLLGPVGCFGEASLSTAACSWRSEGEPTPTEAAAFRAYASSNSLRKSARMSSKMYKKMHI